MADGSLMAWGELTYAKPLTEKQMEDYDCLLYTSAGKAAAERAKAERPPKEKPSRGAER